MVALVTASVTAPARAALVLAGLEVLDIDAIEPGDRMIAAPYQDRFRRNWTKLVVFGLVRWDRLVFLDADMLVRRNMDELFDVQVPVGRASVMLRAWCSS
jgi:alpha-N-acetylglucosamine transferase